MLLAGGRLRGRAGPLAGIGGAHDHGPALEGPGILFTQRQVNSPAPPPVVADLWAAINAATIG